MNTATIERMFAMALVLKDRMMTRPVTLFTGQWADLPLEELCRKASDFGYDGIELASWGDDFEVDRILTESGHSPRDLENIVSGCYEPYERASSKAFIMNEYERGYRLGAWRSKKQFASYLEISRPMQNRLFDLKGNYAPVGLESLRRMVKRLGGTQEDVTCALSKRMFLIRTVAGRAPWLFEPFGTSPASLDDESLLRVDHAVADVGDPNPEIFGSSKRMHEWSNEWAVDHDAFSVEEIQAAVAWMHGRKRLFGFRDLLESLAATHQKDGFRMKIRFLSTVRSAALDAMAHTCKRAAKRFNRNQKVAPAWFSDEFLQYFIDRLEPLTVSSWSTVAVFLEDIGLELWELMSDEPGVVVMKCRGIREEALDLLRAN